MQTGPGKAKAIPDRKLADALVGAGRMASIHVENLSAHEDPFVAVVVDPYYDAATALAKTVKSGTASDLDEALAQHRRGPHRATKAHARFLY
jgi:hypothetical protein